MTKDKKPPKKSKYGKIKKWLRKKIRIKKLILVVGSLIGIAVTAVITGIFEQLGGGFIERIVNDQLSTISSESDGHLLLELSNADHTYEMGLENWRRLDYNRADRDISSARNEISKSVAQSEIEVAKINNSLGCLYLDMGKYEEAYDYLNGAYVVFRDEYGDDSVEARASLFSVAQYDYNTGDFENALKTTQLIIDRSDEEKDLVILTSVKHLRASVYDSLGDYDSAIEVYNEVLEMYDDFLEDGSLTNEMASYTRDSSLSQNEKDTYTYTVQWIILTYIHMGQAYIHKGDYQSALLSLQTGLDISLDNIYIGTKNLNTAKIYMNLARVKKELASTNEALDDIDLAMRIESNLFDFQDKYPGLVEVYDVYGDVLAAKGEKVKASDYYRKALTLALDSFGTNHPQTAEAYSALGGFFLGDENYVEAENYFIHAIDIRKNLLIQNHPVTVNYYIDLASVQAKLNKINDTKNNLDEAQRLCEQLGLKGNYLDKLNETEKLLRDNE